jgi:serine/threonine protein kinase/WD40 repeat protein
MTTSTLGTFVALLKKSQLLSAEQMAQVGELREKLPEAKQLARELIRRNWLTAYQVNQISQGKAGDLVLGSYVILERLGEGGMGQVLKARHKSMGRIVALKVLRKERLANPDAIKRFHREIQAAARLSHPNIVMAYDADAVGNNHFFVMEYVDGTDLSQLVKKKGPLSVPRAFNYMVQAAHGLQHAHDQGMVHRDIKPHNLLMTKDGQTVKILDMGLARLGEADQDSNFTQLTQDGKVVGTPDYIAPEQARNSHTADIRSDIYSLGCTLYFILSGHVPFPGGGSIMEKLMKHQTEEPIPIQLVVPTLPDAVAAVVHKMIRRKPEERYQTPAEVVAALEPFAGRADGDLSTSSTPMIQLGDLNSLTTSTPASVPRLKTSGTVASEPLPEPRVSGRAWLIVAALAGVFVLGTAIAGVAAVVYFNRDPGKIAQKDQEPAPPDKDKGTSKDKEPEGPKDKDKSPPDDKKRTPLDHLGDAPVPVAKLPLHPLEGLVGVLGEPRGRHWSGAPLGRILFSKDGRLIATGGAFGEAFVRLWDANSLQERGQLPVSSATNMVVSGDSTWLAVTAMDGNVNVFDITEAGFGKLLGHYSVPNISQVAFTPEGRVAAATIFDREARSTKAIKVWETRTGTIRRTFTVPEGIITTVSLSPVGLKLAVPVLASLQAKTTTTIKVWDIETDKLLHSIEVGPGFGMPLFTLDGKQLLVVGNSLVRAYDVASGEMKHETALPFAMSPTLSPDGKTMAVLTRTKENKSVVHFYDVASGKLAEPTVELDPSVFTVQFTPDSKAVVASGYRPQLPMLFFEVGTGKPLPRLNGWNGGAAAIGFPPNGRRIVLATPEPALRMWGLGTREEVGAVTGRSGPVTFTAIASDRVLWAGSTESDGGTPVSVLRRWDLPRGEAIAVRDNTPTACWAYDRHNHLLASLHNTAEGGNMALAVKIIHANNGKEVRTLPTLPLGTWVTALAFTPDGKSLVCATHTRGREIKSTILVRDATTGAEQFSMPERPELIHGLFFSRDGKALATLGRDNSLKLYDVASHGERTMPPTVGQTTQVSCFAWRPDGKLVATGTMPHAEQQPFRVWEPGTGKVRHRFSGKMMATAVAFHPDANLLAGADMEGNVTLWNLASEQPVRHWRLAGAANCLNFSNDGRYLITGNGNGTVYVLRLDDVTVAKP